jgi:hypothetical protein
VRNVSDLWIYNAFAFCKVYSDLGSLAGHINGYSHGEYEDVMHITYSSSTVFLSSVNKTTGYGLEGQASRPVMGLLYLYLNGTAVVICIPSQAIPSRT